MLSRETFGINNGIISRGISEGNLGEFSEEIHEGFFEVIHTRFISRIPKGENS